MCFLAGWHVVVKGGSNSETVDPSARLHVIGDFRIVSKVRIRAALPHDIYTLRGVYLGRHSISEMFWHRKLKRSYMSVHKCCLLPSDPSREVMESTLAFEVMVLGSGAGAWRGFPLKTHVHMK